MTITYRPIQVEEKFHRQLKAFAALQGVTIREFVEDACRAQMPAEPLLPFGANCDDNGNPPASP